MRNSREEPSAYDIMLETCLNRQYYIYSICLFFIVTNKLP